MPGVTLEVNGVYYQMDDPVYTSTIRVKTLPPAVLGILYVSFAVLTFGLYICFFMVPVFVCVKGDGYSITSPKQTNDIIYGLGISPEQQPAKGEQL